MNVGIVLFEEVDLLDVGGPYEVFLTASRLAVRDGHEPAFDVVTLSLGGTSVSAYGGLGLTPQGALERAPDLDVVVIPGAVAIGEVAADRTLLETLREVIGATPLVASVCTGAFLLGKLGLLDGVRWTTHWEDVASLRELVAGTGDAWVGWVDADRVVTSGGLSSGIAMALHLVDRLAGRDLAVRTAKQIEYDWDPDGGVISS